MSKYTGTQTERNLEAAFAGESQARNKYTYFASTAKKEGFEQIAAIFLKTAENEKEHAKLWFKELEGLETHSRILKRPPMEKISSGRTCMTLLQRRLKKKDLQSLLQNSVQWPLLKNTTRNATVHFLKM